MKYEEMLHMIDGYIAESVKDFLRKRSKLEMIREYQRKVAINNGS